MKNKFNQNWRRKDCTPNLFKLFLHTFQKIIRKRKFDKKKVARNFFSEYIFFKHRCTEHVISATAAIERRLSILLKFFTRHATHLQFENIIKSFFFLHIDICLKFWIYI